MDSIHAPKRPSIVNLPPNDLCHRLNALCHKPTAEQPGFLLIKASSIPGYNQLDKLNFVKDISHTLTGFLDLNWMYHDQQATVIVELMNQPQVQQAQQSINSTYPDMYITNVLDMRIILNCPRQSPTHTPRYNEPQLYNTHNMEPADYQEVTS